MAKRKDTYYYVLNFLKKNIIDSTYPVYSKLPSEAELSQMLQVSRVTVRKALQTLKDEGMIESRQGSGSYVSIKNTSSFIPVIFSDGTTISRLTEAYQGILDFLTDTGFSPLLFLRGTEPYKEAQIITDCLGKGFKNMIIYPLSSEHNAFLYRKIMQNGANLVFMDTLPHHINCDYVSSCNFSGGYIATKKLIELGHKKIVFCCHNSLDMHNTIGERFTGYKFALEQNGINFSENMVFVRRNVSNEQFAELILDNCEDATAVFSATDELAVAILNKLPSKNKEMAVIGFDNTPTSKTLSLATINQQFYEMGRSAAELLYDRILKPTKPFEHRFLDVELIERNSLTLCPSSTDEKET